ncbi:MAG: hypothetical protein MZV63_60060 [Marinilabiliales bacterium]|nr:hypothetical protein [Marinilabiliales bacterium]
MDYLPNFKKIIAHSPLIFTIGVAGDSGSGKDHVYRCNSSYFWSDLVSTITLDDYHKYDREERKRLGITLNPDANNLADLESDIALLKAGHSIRKPAYNHATGRFDPAIPFTPHKILILEGLHTLFTPGLRKQMDFSIFVDPEKEVKYEWKRRRDMAWRDTSGAVAEEIGLREDDYEAFIAPQRCNKLMRSYALHIPNTGRTKENLKIFTGYPCYRTR